jgi:type I restriction enzyme S subunit
MTFPLNDLPDGWAKTTLGEVTAQKVTQGAPSPGSFRYIDIASVSNVTKQVTDAKLIPSAKAPSRARQHVKMGDVLVSMTRPNLNAVAKVTQDFDSSVASTGFHVLRAIEVEPDWLLSLVKSRSFIDAMSRLVQGALYPPCCSP